MLDALLKEYGYRKLKAELDGRVLITDSTVIMGYLYNEVSLGNQFRSTAVTDALEKYVHEFPRYHDVTPQEVEDRIREFRELLGE